MKTALKISILLNVVLLACLVLQAVNRLKSPGMPEQPVAVATQPAATEPKAPLPTPVPPPARSEPFRWDQLYAKDYHIYVKNLRAIGCPEETLRAIVAADVHVVFQKRADELEKKVSDLAGSSWSKQLGSWSSEQAWKTELRQLPDEEMTVLADCLGESTTPASSTPAPDNHRVAATAAKEPAIELPLVEQPVDLAALNLDSSQLQAIDDVRRSFLQNIGGPGQDPRDPAYQARWRAAQAESDDLMKGMIGTAAFEDYQEQALVAAQAQATANPPPADSSSPARTTGN